jgi:death on curing protein
MTDRIVYLDLEDALALTVRLLGDPAPVRDVGLLGSAMVRPQMSVGGVDAYPNLWLKAAALLDSIVNNHPLIDGNKRLGWLATAVFLELNDLSVVDASNDAVFDLVIGVASSNMPLDEIAHRLSQLAAVR